MINAMQQVEVFGPFGSGAPNTGGVELFHNRESMKTVSGVCATLLRDSIVIDQVGIIEYADIATIEEHNFAWQWCYDSALERPVDIGVDITTVQRFKYRLIFNRSDKADTEEERAPRSEAARKMIAELGARCLTFDDQRVVRVAEQKLIDEGIAAQKLVDARDAHHQQLLAKVITAMDKVANTSGRTESFDDHTFTADGQSVKAVIDSFIPHIHMLRGAQSKVDEAAKAVYAHMNKGDTAELEALRAAVEGTHAFKNEVAQRLQAHFQAELDQRTGAVRFRN